MANNKKTPPVAEEDGMPLFTLDALSGIKNPVEPFEITGLFEDDPNKVFRAYRLRDIPIVAVDRKGSGIFSYLLDFVASMIVDKDGKPLYSREQWRNATTSYSLNKIADAINGKADEKNV